jgi:hypothetical protein
VRPTRIFSAVYKQEQLEAHPRVPTREHENERTLPLQLAVQFALAPAQHTLYATSSLTSTKIQFSDGESSAGSATWDGSAKMASGSGETTGSSALPAKALTEKRRTRTRVIQLAVRNLFMM